jgi:hypothetical protein
MMSLRAFQLVSCASVLLFGVRAVDAQILKCKDSAGQVTYTQATCPPGTRPLDSPDSVGSDTTSNSSNRPVGPRRTLSPRAAELRKKADACRESFGGECQEFKALEERCLNESNRGTADCAAMREVSDSTANDFWDAVEQAGKTPPEQEKCSAMLAFEGSDADVRACSSSRSFPSTVHWAQVRQHTNDLGSYRQWTGDYICLRFIAIPNAEGGSTRVRPYLTVRDAMRAGAKIPGFELAQLPHQVFPTKVAAVEAGCAAANSE